jgi:hypothetical protein
MKTKMRKKFTIILVLVTEEEGEEEMAKILHKEMKVIVIKLFMKILIIIRITIQIITNLIINKSKTIIM